MNFIFISPNYPWNYWQFCDRLKRNGVNVLGIGDAPYFQLNEQLRSTLTEYYYVNSLQDYDQVYRAVAFFAFKYGRIDWLESNNEFWLEQDARLRTDFHITTGVREHETGPWKCRSAMKTVFGSAGIPTVRGRTVLDLEDARRAVEEVGGYPVVLQPDASAGQADTYKATDDASLEEFFRRPYAGGFILCQWLMGDICSYDAITDSGCAPLFESMTVWPPAVAEIVKRDLDPACYTCAEVPERLRELGRRTLRAFDVRSRFVAVQFVRLAEAREGVGAAGDFIALEAGMRPAGGQAPDMMNFACSTDVYRIWADMVTEDRRVLPESQDHHWCVCAATKDWHRYRHTQDEILRRYGSRIALCQRAPEEAWRTMGCQMYTAHAYSEEQVREFIDFVHEREA